MRTPGLLNQRGERQEDEIHLLCHQGAIYEISTCIIVTHHEQLTMSHSDHFSPLGMGRVKGDYGSGSAISSSGFQLRPVTVAGFFNFPWDFTKETLRRLKVLLDSAVLGELIGLLVVETFVVKLIEKPICGEPKSSMLGSEVKKRNKGRADNEDRLDKDKKDSDDFKVLDSGAQYSLKRSGLGPEQVHSSGISLRNSPGCRASRGPCRPKGLVCRTPERLPAGLLAAVALVVPPLHDLKPLLTGKAILAVWQATSGVRKPVRLSYCIQYLHTTCGHYLPLP
ncbi:hypothetical protein BX600DRAFT_440177 [Xylariales sp. PMI_506]|nr:hypothetical protein BX600DRAFT_440177 [Xylariales sp. PMI_506]